MKKNTMLSKIMSKGIILVNSLALIMVINNINVACAWIWGQPETPDELKEKYRKF
ncbi:MAG: cyclic lactone autoinducer peptide [Muricomes sp.]